MPFLVLPWLLLLPGCLGHMAGSDWAGGDTDWPGSAVPYVQGIQVINGAGAPGLGWPAAPFELRFGDGQDGTKVMLDFFNAAKRSGALYVSDIRIELRGQRAGEPVICATELVPADPVLRELVRQQQPSPIERRYAPKLVTATVTDNTYSCHNRRVRRTHRDTRLVYQWDRSTRTYCNMPVTQLESTFEHRQDCQFVPVTRTVTRYEYQLQTRFVPPNLTYVEMRYGGYKAVESPPRCRPAAESAAMAPTSQLPHRIAALVYREPSR